MSKLIKTWITSCWTLTSARCTPFCVPVAFHAHLKLQSLPKVNRMTFGLLEDFSVKTDMGWFLTTDRPQISIHKYYREANWGWPSHKHSTNLFLLSGVSQFCATDGDQLLLNHFIIYQCFILMVMDGNGDKKSWNWGRKYLHFSWKQSCFAERSLQFNEQKPPWASLDVALICRVLEIIRFDITAHY